MNLRSRSLTCSSASCAGSSRRPQAAGTTSRRSGAAATRCGSRSPSGWQAKSQAHNRIPHPLPCVLSADCRFSGFWCLCGASPLTSICGNIAPVDIRTPQLKPLNSSQGVCDAGCNIAPPSYSAPDERQHRKQRAPLRKVGQSALHELAARGGRVALLSRVKPSVNHASACFTWGSRAGRAPSDLETVAHGG